MTDLLSFDVPARIAGYALCVLLPTTYASICWVEHGIQHIANTPALRLIHAIDWLCGLCYFVFALFIYGFFHQIGYEFSSVKSLFVTLRVFNFYHVQEWESFKVVVQASLSLILT